MTQEKHRVISNPYVPPLNTGCQGAGKEPRPARIQPSQPFALDFPERTRPKTNTEAERRMYATSHKHSASHYQLWRVFLDASRPLGSQETALLERLKSVIPRLRSKSRHFKKTRSPPINSRSCTASKKPFLRN